VGAILKGHRAVNLLLNFARNSPIEGIDLDDVAHSCRKIV
jgi:hypothetical protein